MARQSAQPFETLSKIKLYNGLTGYQAQRQKGGHKNENMSD